MRRTDAEHEAAARAMTEGNVHWVFLGGGRGPVPVVHAYGEARIGAMSVCKGMTLEYDGFQEEPFELWEVVRASHKRKRIKTKHCGTCERIVNSMARELAKLSDSFPDRFYPVSHAKGING
jgi:hypothetical protein